jgi:hypothetical protein
VYLPKWIIIIKAGASTYKRKALAASNKIIIDEIAVCPKHFSVPKIWNRHKLILQYVKYVEAHSVVIISLKLVIHIFVKNIEP